VVTARRGGQQGHRALNHPARLPRPVIHQRIGRREIPSHAKPALGLRSRPQRVIQQSRVRVVIGRQRLVGVLAPEDLAPLGALLARLRTRRIRCRPKPTDLAVSRRRVDRRPLTRCRIRPHPAPDRSTRPKRRHHHHQRHRSSTHQHQARADKAARTPCAPKARAGPHPTPRPRSRTARRKVRLVSHGVSQPLTLHAPLTAQPPTASDRAYSSEPKLEASLNSWRAAATRPSRKPSGSMTRRRDQCQMTDARQPPVGVARLRLVTLEKGSSQG